MPVRLVAVILMALAAAGCAPDFFVGLGLPRNDACNDASTFPGRPISNDCFNTLYGPP